ncbi:MAG TPA: HAD family hydrolase [Streptosporangiaceae bacterium]|nr:HAD family hydrolase [Streptosporangiaceae bacterium]
MAVEAVIFDWGGTLTPWHTVDHEALWLEVCSAHFAAPAAAEMAAAIVAAEAALWRVAERDHRGATLADLFEGAGVTAAETLLGTYFAVWEPHTYTDPSVPDLLRGLRARGIKVGVLSNTLWPRARHELIFARDGVLSLIDGAVYSSELGTTKPHQAAFRAAMDAVGVTDPGTCVFVGDRLYDDIYGAQGAGMRAVHIPHSAVPRFDGVTPDAVVQQLAEIATVIDYW